MGTKARFIQNDRTWVVEAPRKGEQPPGQNGRIFIFPTLEEGKKLAQPGSFFTADTVLLDGTKLEKAIYTK